MVVAITTVSSYTVVHNLKNIWQTFGPAFLVVVVQKGIYRELASHLVMEKKKNCHDRRTGAAGLDMSDHIHIKEKRLISWSRAGRDGG